MNVKIISTHNPLIWMMNEIWLEFFWINILQESSFKDRGINNKENLQNSKGISFHFVGESIVDMFTKPEFNLNLNLKPAWLTATPFVTDLAQTFNY